MSDWAPRGIQRDKVIQRSVEGLGREWQSKMATLILAGYKFELGNVYWFVDGPNGEKVARLERSLTECIRMGNLHWRREQFDG